MKLFIVLLCFHALSKTCIEIISDVDDTIRRTDVIDKKNALRNLLFGLEPYEDLKSIYKDLKKKGAKITYLSNAPEGIPGIGVQSWVEDNEFPMGDYRQRPLSYAVNPFMSKSSFKIDTLKEKFNNTYLKKMKKKCSKIKFFLFGDSGEHDALIYKEFLKKLKKEKIPAMAFIRVLNIPEAEVSEEIKRNSQINAFSVAEELTTSTFLSEELSEDLLLKLSTQIDVSLDTLARFGGKIENLVKLTQNYNNCLSE